MTTAFNVEQDAKTTLFMNSNEVGRVTFVRALLAEKKNKVKHKTFMTNINPYNKTLPSRERQLCCE